MTGEVPAAATALATQSHEQNRGPSKGLVVFMGVMTAATLGVTAGFHADGGQPVDVAASAEPSPPNDSMRQEVATEYRAEQRTRNIELAVEFIIAKQHEEQNEKERELQRLINEGLGPPTAADWVFLNCTIGHESRSAGLYRAINHDNNAYFGAYQFGPRTWDNVGRRVGVNILTHGRSWVGVRPDQAPPDIQDYFATVLHREAGNSPWEGRC